MGSIPKKITFQIYLNTGKQDSLQSKCLKYIFIWFSFIKNFKILPSLGTVNSERKLHWQEAMKMAHVPNENQCSHQTWFRSQSHQEEKPWTSKKLYKSFNNSLCDLLSAEKSDQELQWLIRYPNWGWVVQGFKSMVSTTAMPLNCSHYSDYSVIHMKYTDTAFRWDKVAFLWIVPF